MNPFLSIIIPTFNRELLVQRALQSLLTQNYKDFEILIIDDGSTDQTRDLIRSLVNDGFVNYVFKPNGGVAGARNLGARLAKGKYLAFLDSDDFFDPNWSLKFNRVLNESDFDIGFCYSEIIDDKTFKRKRIDSYKFCKTASGLIAFSNLAGSFIIKRSLFLESGGYNESLRYSENFELINRILFYKKPNCIYLNEILVYLGNSLNDHVRRGKYSQQIVKESLEKILELNPEYWQKNLDVKLRFVKKLIVSNTVLACYRMALKLIAQNISISPLHFLKISLLVILGPLYRAYLVTRGYRF